jgi:predicted homoserine dehydrogenase-like protein
MRCVVLCDAVLENCYLAFGHCGVRREDVVVATDVATANRAIREGRAVATTDWQVVCGSDVTVVVESTGRPDVCAQVSLTAIQACKHVIALSVEMDVLIGSLLKRKADEAGVVYSVASGDEPGVLIELYDFAVSLGFEVVAAGKSPFKPINRQVVIEDVLPEAVQFHLNPKMLCSFRDGSKTDIEMACVANATGMPPDVRGMHGPTAALADLARIFSLKAQGGVLNKAGVVDFAGPVLAPDGSAIPGKTVAPGVWLVFSTDHQKIRDDLQWLMMGDGPNYVLYRPFHLVAIEVPISIAHAAVHRESWLASLPQPVAEVTTVAKRYIQAGEVLDGAGGYTVHGMIDLAETAVRERYLPLGLAYGVRVTRDIPRGDPITYADVDLDESALVVRLKKEQDALVARIQAGASPVAGSNSVVRPG